MDLDNISADPPEVNGTTILAVALALGVAVGLSLGVRMGFRANRVERRMGEYVQGFSLIRSGGRR